MPRLSPGRSPYLRLIPTPKPTATHNRHMALPLPYGTIRDLYNSREGQSINPFFGRWIRLSAAPTDFQSFRYFLDTTTQRVYHHPMVTEGGLTAPAPYYIGPSAEQIPLTQMSRHMPRVTGTVFVQAATMDGNLLIAATSTAASNTTALAAAAYKTLATTAPVCARATRAVLPADRQIHWVWFRRTPTWRLTEEIVLRAASWIELNPGYQFHLWTNLADAAELTDFLADLPTDVRERYFSTETPRITVHFAAEFRDTVFDWLAANVNAETQAVFATVWESRERQDIIMKTDYTRNILLAVRGGIYTDFNDLMCLAPIEPVLEAHAGAFIGVTDNNTSQNASNYFMYAAAGNTDWNRITVRCTETLPAIRALIYDSAAEAAARGFVTQVLEGRAVDMTAIQTVVNAYPTYRDRIQAKHFLYSVCMAVEFALGREAPGAHQIAEFLRRNRHGRMKPTFQSEVIGLLSGIRGEVAQIMADADRFAASWRFARTDMYLNFIMHSSNLPIYCRQKEIPIWLTPFSYLLRYACLLSFVGHLGDGSSYGMDPSRQVTMRRLLAVPASTTPV